MFFPQHRNHREQAAKLREIETFLLDMLSTIQHTRVTLEILADFEEAVNRKPPAPKEEPDPSPA